MKKDSLASKLGHWTGLYAAYLFLAGWSYLKYYFGVFGVDTGWLDLGLNDTMAQGFSVLFGSGVFLSIVYVVVFLLSVAVEAFPRNRSRLMDMEIPLFLVFLFPVTYGIARRAGIGQANVDRGDKPSLPTLVFTAGSCDYRGKLVYLKSELFYVSNLHS
jgi:hypothetical protein